MQSKINSEALTPSAIFSLSETDANVSVNCSFAKNSSLNASRSANWLPSSCAGGSKLGVVGRMNGVGDGGGWAAQRAASASDSSPHTVHDDVTGDDVTS